MPKLALFHGPKLALFHCEIREKEFSHLAEMILFTFRNHGDSTDLGKARALRLSHDLSRDHISLDNCVRGSLLLGTG